MHFQLAHGALAFDDLPLECDGMTKVMSAVLERDSIEHRCMVGSLSVEGAGTIPCHHWILMPDGHIIDLRARMWLGNDERVPHGFFKPKRGVFYNAVGNSPQRLMPLGFFVLANMDLASAPALLDRVSDTPR
ncbi:hypothetical protein [Hydrogenophaga sp. NFH-34]|uniref:hypothetical protein n=1 Tax=Hydrogenophaga sp. NFH-34 TaxID=2744446 RepID=UPI001F2133DC|nr:hypothetical protein [Hydrogenophaga sp. NFH-34]